MQKGHELQFPCQNCQNDVLFSIFELNKLKGQLSCPNCKMAYDFCDDTLQRQLGKFAALCNQIHDSEEILSNTSVGVFVGEKEVKIPFKILLSRLNSKLDLIVGSKPLSIIFRIEPSSLRRENK